MKKTLLITVGIVLILLVLGAWGYLMFFGTPDNPQEVFTDLGFDLGDQTTVVTPPVIEEPLETFVDTQSEPLRQLTTRPVAGFVVFFSTSSDSNLVRYSERGTGHIYEINVSTGDERRVSGTTIPRVTEAEFSSDGNYVALTSVSQSVRDVFVGEITENTASGAIVGHNIPPGSDEIALEGSDVYYIRDNSQGTTGFRFNITSTNQDELFSTPFSSIRMIWQPDQIFFYNRVTAEFTSALYQITDNSFITAAPAQFGRTAMVGSTFIVLTEIDGDGLSSSALNQISQKETTLGINTVPEKCAFDTLANNVVFCVSPIESLDADYLEDWYKGLITSKDLLWEIDLQTGEALLLVDPLSTSGRTIDGIHLQTDDLSNALYFINKIDDSLWTYDLLAS